MTTLFHPAIRDVHRLGPKLGGASNIVGWASVEERVQLDQRINGGSAWWSLDFKAPNGAELTPGPYEGAARYPFQSPATPGLDVSGSGRGCNNLTGRFDVLEAVYGADGSVQRFAADFEQHCEGGAPALRGSVRFNSSL